MAGAIHCAFDITFSQIFPDNSYSTRQNRQRLLSDFRPILIRKLDEKFDIQFGDDNDTRYKKLDKYLQLYQEELTIPILSPSVVAIFKEVMSI